MKICFFSLVTYWHGLRGGMDFFGKMLLEGLVKRGHEISVISSSHPEGKSLESVGNIKIHYLTETQFGSIRKGWSRESRKKFLELHKIRAFDIILSQQPIFPRIPGSLRRRVPIMTLVQGHEGWIMLSEWNVFLNIERRLLFFVKYLISFLYHYLRWEFPNFCRSDLVVTPANEVSASLSHWFPIGRERIRTIYNAVDTNHFRPDPTARQRVTDRYPALAGKSIILYMSHVTRQKGLPLLLKTLPRLMTRGNDAALLVVGGGDFLQGAKEMAQQLGMGGRVVFAGMVETDSLPEHINTADVFVLPTLRMEGLPLSILEAMACNVPVIASDIGGNASAVKDKITGILVPPGDATKLEEAIHLVLNDRAFARQLADRGYQSVLDTFGPQEMIDRFESLMNDTVADKQAKSRGPF